LTLKVALTWRAALMVSSHGPVPLQAPFQPTKVDPGAALAVSVTLVPSA
jgi:hypothetical protein